MKGYVLVVSLREDCRYVRICHSTRALTLGEVGGLEISSGSVKRSGESELEWNSVLLYSIARETELLGVVMPIAA